MAVYNPDRFAILNGLGSGGVGNGAFGAAALYSTISNPYDLRFADFNGDGIPDVAVSGIGGLSVSFGRGSGGMADGTFGPAQTVFTEPLTGLEVGDFNGDGVSDLAAVGAAYGSELYLFLGQATEGVPNGLFTFALERSAGSGPIQMARGDFNSDGRTDLAIANYYGGTLSILLNLGPGHGPSATAGWAADGVSLSSATGAQTNPRAVPDGAGGAIAVWEDRRSGANAVYAQRVGRNGNILWRADGIRIASDSTDYAQPRIAADGLGGVWVGWLQADASSPAAVRLQHVSASGAKDAALLAAGIAISEPGFVATDLTLSADGSGGVLVGYVGAGSDAVAALYCQRVGAGESVPAGWPSAAGVEVARWSGTGSGSFAAPDLSPDETGGASITWRTRGDSDPTCASGACVYSGVARVGGSGTLLHGDAFRFPEDDACGVPAGPGSEVIVTQTGDSKILARRIGPAGGVDWTTQLCAAAGERRLGSLAPLAGGGAATAWIDRRMGDWDLYLSRVAADGSLASGWPADGLPVCVASGDQVEPRVLATSAQGLTVCWVDRSTGNDHRARRERNAARWLARGRPAGLFSSRGPAGGGIGREPSGRRDRDLAGRPERQRRHLRAAHSGRRERGRRPGAGNARTRSGRSAAEPGAWRGVGSLLVGGRPARKPRALRSRRAENSRARRGRHGRRLPPREARSRRAARPGPLRVEAPHCRRGALPAGRRHPLTPGGARGLAQPSELRCATAPARRGLRSASRSSPICA